MPYPNPNLAANPLSYAEAAKETHASLVETMRLSRAQLRPGSEWRHKKSGTICYTLFASLREEDLVPLVTYGTIQIAEEPVPVLWTRTLANFLERFEPLGDRHEP